MNHKPLILASLLLAAFLINLETTIVNVALPTLVRELHATDSQLQWVVDAYNLVFAASVLAAGSLSDRFGRKGMLLAGLVVFGAASFAGGLTDDPGQLIAARAVMGIGAAMVFPSTLSMLVNAFTERGERARAIGLWGATSGAAIALGPIVGGWLLEISDWRSIFFVMAPIAAIAGIMTARYLPASRDPDAPSIDRAGFVLSTATIGLVVFTIIEAPGHGWGSARTLGGFAVAALLATAFVAWERRTEHPLVDVNLFRNPRFAAASAAIGISFFALSGFIFLVTQMFQFLKGYGPLSTGVRILPVALCVGISSILGTKLAVRVGTTLGVAVIGSVYASLYASRLTSALPGDLPASVDQAAHGSVGAAFATAEQLDLAGQPALGSAIHDGASAAFFHGFAAANYVAAGVAAAGALLALAFVPAHPKTDPDETAEPRPLGSPAPAPARS